MGVGPLPVNITEYAMRRDMSVPGQLVQWISMFEDEKVDAQTAYWTFAGNLNDNMAKNNSANGAWWLLKWYADLTGETVELTPPALNAVDTLQGTAALDDERRQATVLFGGGSEDVRVEISGIDTQLFGDTVDVQVREAEWSGQEGEALAPRTIAAERVSVVDGTVQILVPNDDRQSAYQVVLTPAQAKQPTIDTSWRSVVEAEATTLRDAKVDNQPPATPGRLRHRVRRTSAVWTRPPRRSPGRSTCPRRNLPARRRRRDQHDRRARGVRRRAPRHHDPVRGRFQYPLPRTRRDPGPARGGDARAVPPDEHRRGDALARLQPDRRPPRPRAGPRPRHRALPGAPGAPLGSRGPLRRSRHGGSVRLESGSSATFYVSSRDTGYDDLLLDYSIADAAAIGLAINGRPIHGLAASSGGDWTSSARVHLAQGISEITVTSPDGVDLRSLTTVRAEEGDECRPGRGGSRSDPSRRRADRGVNQPTNASGSVVSWLGGDAESYAVWTRPEGIEAGAYNFIAHYSNAEKNTGHAYNTDVITRFLDIAEEGGSVTRGAYRHNYSWQGTGHTPSRSTWPPTTARSRSGTPPGGPRISIPSPSLLWCCR
ncbi:hypothetical protein NKG05_04990 [Oerskovia sp. M15]